MPQINIYMILDFFDEMGKRNFPIYNERSLQFELGRFLQKKCDDDFKDDGYKVEYERNVKRKPINPDGKKIDSVKKNTDIFIYSETDPNLERYAIELKYPRNVAEDKRFFDFSKDIRFMEDVKDSLKNVETYCLTIVSNTIFYEKKDNEDSKYKEMFEFYRTWKPYASDSNNERSLSDGGTGPYFEITSRGKLVGVQLKHGYKIKWNRAYDRKEKSDIFQCDGYEAPGKLPVYFYFVEI